MALRLASELGRAFGDGVWYVKLAGLHQPALLPHTVANALGLRDGAADWTLETLAPHLEGKTMLLVLDNCEHIVDACAELAQGLLAASPELRILATSRERLRVPGEFAVPIPPLSTPSTTDAESATGDLMHYEAIQLFVDRASARCPGIEIDGRNRNEVAQICRRLDGIPLAIELAADRVKTLSLHQIREKLASRLDLLTNGPRGVPPRQQTLRASLDWSYELCSEAEKDLWARLSVFAGEFELDAVEGVCQDDQMASADIVDVVEGLLDKSIVVREERDSRIRFRMLETIREYGHDRLVEAQQDAQMRRRHRDWYESLATHMAEHWIGSEQVDWLRRFRDEHANLRGALAYTLADQVDAEPALRIAAALAWYWHARGALSEGRHWLTQALAQTDKSSQARIDGLRVNAFLAILQGDADAADRSLSEALATPEVENWPQLMASLDMTSGLQALLVHRLDEASKYFAAALPTFRESGGVEGEIFTSMLDGMALAFRGDRDAAKDRFAKVLANSDQTGDLWFKSYTLLFLGVVHWMEGHLDTATDLARQALRGKVLFDDHTGLVLCLEALAFFASSSGDWKRTAIILGAADTIWGKTGTTVDNFADFKSLHDECEAQLAPKLPKAALATMRQQGSELPASQAIAYALGEHNEPGAEATGSSTMGFEPLTRREWQVAENVAEGRSNRQIANKLVISPRTVDGHIEHILSKLGFSTRTQIASWVAERQNHPGPRQEQ
nr:LuxR C-terminal-related transcriptional regulator [Haloechinothrix alba]